jgi:hypothetical protein
MWTRKISLIIIVFLSLSPIVLFSQHKFEIVPMEQYYETLDDETKYIMKILTTKEVLRYYLMTHPSINAKDSFYLKNDPLGYFRRKETKKHWFNDFFSFKFEIKPWSIRDSFWMKNFYILEKQNSIILESSTGEQIDIGSNKQLFPGDSLYLIYFNSDDYTCLGVSGRFAINKKIIEFFVENFYVTKNADEFIYELKKIELQMIHLGEKSRPRVGLIGFTGDKKGISRDFETQKNRWFFAENCSTIAPGNVLIKSPKNGNPSEIIYFTNDPPGEEDPMSMYQVTYYLHDNPQSYDDIRRIKKLSAQDMEQWKAEFPDWRKYMKMNRLKYRFENTCLDLGRWFYSRFFKQQKHK